VGDTANVFNYVTINILHKIVKYWLEKFIICLFLSATFSCTNIQNPKLVLTDEDYKAAKALDNPQLSKLVLNANIAPHWIGNEDKFWYSVDRAGRKNIILVNAETGKKKKAYNIEEMVKALTSYTENAGTVASEPSQLKNKNGSLIAIFNLANQVYTCTTIKPVCESSKRMINPANLLVAPNKQVAVFVREHDLWLKYLVTDKETQLTNDGAKYAGYAELSSHNQLDSIRNGLSLSNPPFYTHWSPNSQFLITRYFDERDVESYPFVESVPSNASYRPRIHSIKTALLGDSKLPRIKYIVFNIKTGSRKELKLPIGYDFEDSAVSNKPLGWNEDSSKAYFYISTVSGQSARVIEIDVKTGKIRNILEENAPNSRVNLSSSLLINPAIQINGNELIWYSEKSNWGHLYLYDIAKAKQIKTITKGNWAVHSIVHFDKEKRSLIIVGMGREEGSDPYWKRLYRVSLNDGEIVLLTPEAATHEVSKSGISATGKYMVQSYSTVNQPPRTVIRHIWKKQDAIELETADASALYAMKWTAPQRFKVKAANGKIDLYAVVFSPNQQFNAQTKLPIVDANYMNSILSITPVDFMTAVKASSAAAMTRLGFYVVLVDGRGTPNRSRAFREAGYPAFYDIQIDDHIAAISQLAMKNQIMDLNRVGIYGHSNGGSGAARAILKRPNFYKVAVASAGSHDYMSLPPSGVKYFGRPIYENGTSIRPTADAIPKNYSGFDNAALVKNLSGHLMLAYADMDGAAFPAATLRLANALTKAGKRYDLVYLANEGHQFSHNPYFLQIRQFYLVEHLHKIDPPNSLIFN